MTQQEYNIIEAHMLACMTDSAHDPFHIYRVLYAALDIAQTEDGVDGDLLIAACLLHDIARDLQAQDPSVCHAHAGGEMARVFLMDIGWNAERAGLVREAIRTHRYRASSLPETLEAKILFDADKLDAAGAFGIARTLLYGGQTGEPLYALDGEGMPITRGIPDEHTTFLQEFNFKLLRVYDGFYTRRAREVAVKRRRAAMEFYEELLDEIGVAHREGGALLARRLSD